jgi:hypothetical protein
MAFIFDFDPHDYEDEEEQSSRPSAFIAALWLLMLMLAPAVGIAVVISVVLIALFPIAFVSVWPSITSAMEVEWIRALAVAAFFAFGVVLYFIRRFFRVIYGTLELSVGIAATWACLSRPDLDRLAVTLGIIGGSYIIVRGLDNIAQARNAGIVSVGRMRLIEKNGEILARDTWSPDKSPRTVRLDDDSEQT